jgi:hypothetical protein
MADIKIRLQDCQVGGAACDPSRLIDGAEIVAQGFNQVCQGAAMSMFGGFACGQVVAKGVEVRCDRVGHGWLAS